MELVKIKTIDTKALLEKVKQAQNQFKDFIMIPYFGGINSSYDPITITIKYDVDFSLLNAMLTEEKYGIS